MPRPLLLAVAGMVGTGKTTLTTALARRFGLQTALESVDDDNPWLARFYGPDASAKAQYALRLQLHFLATRFRDMRRMRAQGGGWILDRTWYEDAEIFARGLFEQELLTPHEYELYERLYAELLTGPAARGSSTPATTAGSPPSAAAPSCASTSASTTSSATPRPSTTSPPPSAASSNPSSPRPSSSRPSEPFGAGGATTGEPPPRGMAGHHGTTTGNNGTAPFEREVLGHGAEQGVEEGRSVHRPVTVPGATRCFPWLSRGVPPFQAVAVQPYRPTADPATYTHRPRFRARNA